MSTVLTGLRPYITLLRPYQWVKNVLVFSGLIFSTSLFKMDGVPLSIAAFFIFCFASSCVYILNDICDYKNDKAHPVKKNRPIASGKVPKSTAIILLAILFPTVLIAAWFLSMQFFIIVAVYLLFNIAYSLGLKKVVLLDVMIVAFGFLLRAVAGCVVINVQVTPWLFICTLCLALTLSFGKRRNELNVLHDDAGKHRSTLEFYNVKLLDVILTICCATTIATYSLYTMAQETVIRFGTQKLIITLPFVMYGVFRYLYLIYVKNKGGDPTLLLVKDLPTMVNAALWLLSVIYVVYGSKWTQFISV
jgi:4-hydroxybenzoate polyprenyltransferase